MKDIIISDTIEKRQDFPKHNRQKFIEQLFKNISSKPYDKMVVGDYLYMKFSVTTKLGHYRLVVIPRDTNINKCEEFSIILLRKKNSIGGRNIHKNDKDTQRDIITRTTQFIQDLKNDNVKIYKVR